METISVEEALKLAFAELRRILVPAEYSEQIGMPVQRSMMTIKKCVDALADVRKQQEEKLAEEGGEEAADAE